MDISIFTWIPWKKLNSCFDLPYCEIFKIGNANLQFQNPGYGWQKNEKKEKKNKGNSKRYVFHANAKSYGLFQLTRVLKPGSHLIYNLIFVQGVSKPMVPRKTFFIKLKERALHLPFLYYLLEN